jgi:hypothetical protein
MNKKDKDAINKYIPTKNSADNPSNSSSFSCELFGLFNVNLSPILI